VRRELIERTYECLPRARGRSSTSTTRPSLQPGGVRPGPTGIVEIATGAAALARMLKRSTPGTEIRYEYSPEASRSPSRTFAVEICEAVMDVLLDAAPMRRTRMCGATHPHCRRR